MTVASSTSKSGPYACNGVTVAFAISFACSAASDLSVYRTDASAFDTALVLNTDYTVSLNADQTNSPGGTVTLTSAPPAGYQVTILRNVAFTQGTSLPNQGGWYPKVVENAFDKLTMIVQQLSEKVSRSVQVGVTSSDTAALVSAIYSAGAYATAYATSAGASLLGFIQSGIGAVARSIQDELRDVIRIKQFGATGLGVASDTAAFRAALVRAAGKKLRLPAGNYRIEFTETNALDIPANIEIEGDGMATTTITFVPSSTTYRNLMSVPSGGLTLRGLKVTTAVPAGGQVSLFSIGAGNIVIDQCDLDGGMTNVGVALSHSAFGFNIADTGTQNDIRIERCILHRMTYPWLKTNAATSTQRRLKFLNNYFNSNYNDDLGLNSPNGICDDVLIDGNTFGGNLSISAGLTASALGVALASVTNFRITNNHFSDSYTDAVHIEEGSYYGAVEKNTFDVDGRCISFNGNNISGTIKTPTGVSVLGNVLKKQGTQKESGKHGVVFVLNASGHLPLFKSVVAGNIIVGYEYGIWNSASHNDGNNIRENNIIGCSQGIRFHEGVPLISGNTTNLCDIGIQGDSGTASFEGGTVLNHTFIDCTVNVDSVDIPVTLINPTFIFGSFDHAGGGTSVYKNCLALAADDRAHGFMSMSADCDNTLSYSKARDEVTWDGTTYTRTGKISINPGSIVVTAVRNASFLAVNVFAANARTNVRLSVKFDGMAVVAL